MKTRFKTAKEYENLALSRMTGEQIANELTSDEAEEYYYLLDIGGEKD